MKRTEAQRTQNRQKYSNCLEGESRTLAQDFSTGNASRSGSPRNQTDISILTSKAKRIVHHLPPTCVGIDRDPPHGLQMSVIGALNGKLPLASR
jgi:hypothetical protein